jgi:predicted dehydrogenase
MEPKETASPIRIGILGAARIAPAALVRPAREVDGVVAHGIAARVPARAGEFQIKHGITKAYPSYEALLNDEEIGAVYNPLPNGLHAAWSIRALEAGKHVLCEKPLAANAAEVTQMRDTAQRCGLHLMEAFHYRYHPLADRMRAIIESGELGEIKHVEASLCFPLPFFNDIRYDFGLAGGSLMDAGCYAVHLVRFLANAEPEVVSARATLRNPDIDRAMEADLRFPDGRTGQVRSSLFSRRLLSVFARVVGDRGEMRVDNPILPHFFHRLRVRTRGGRRREVVAGEATYTAQLRAFVRLITEGTPVPTGPDDALANMRVIDAIYEKASMRRRGSL